jgi:hypothetical protein
MSASVSLSDIERMLNKCAPGHTMRRTTHGHIIHFGKLMFRDLPKFDQIEIGHVRKMARHFGILKCAKKYGVA